MNRLFIIPFICLILISCGKKSELELKPYIETITNGKVTCYRVVDIRYTMFGKAYNPDDIWDCNDGTIKSITR